MIYIIFNDVNECGFSNKSLLHATRKSDNLLFGIIVNIIYNTIYNIV